MPELFPLLPLCLRTFSSKTETPPSPEGVACLPAEWFLHQHIFVLLTLPPFADPFLKSTFIAAQQDRSF